MKDDEDVSPLDRKIGKTAAGVLGGRPTVARYRRPRGGGHVDVLSSIDRPQPGVTSYATIGAHRGKLVFEGKPYPARVELVGACGSPFEKLANVLADCAFEILDGHFCAPGVIFPEIVRRHRPKGPMAHVMFVPPFLWPDLRTIVDEPPPIAWLLAVPISHSELAYAMEHGPAALERAMEEAHVDIYDIDRDPIV